MVLKNLNVSLIKTVTCYNLLPVLYNRAYNKAVFGGILFNKKTLVHTRSKKLNEPVTAFFHFLFLFYINMVRLEMKDQLRAAIRRMLEG